MGDYTIDKVSWHTSVQGNPETEKYVVERIWHFVDFLQRNHLMQQDLAENIDDIDDEFSIKASHLNDEGIFIVKKCYDRWLTKVDKGGNPNDMGIFERQLIKIRLGSNQAKCL